jgi:hypothetical protein
MDEAELLMARTCPDIAVFTETWLERTTSNDGVAVPGYSTIRCDRSHRQGGGILCYIKDSLSFSPVDLQQPTDERCSESLCFFVRDFNLALLVLYHPHWNDSKAHDAAMSLITQTVDFLIVTYGPRLRIIVCGDFNDLRHSYNLITSVTSLSPVVNFATRGANTLDQVFTNFATDKAATQLPPLGRSDHCVVLWSPSLPTRSTPVKKTVRKFSRANVSRFLHAVARVDWLAMAQSSDDVDHCASRMMNCLSTLFHQHFPKRTIRLRSDDPEWMSPSLKILIDDRDRAFSNKQWNKFRRLREEVLSHLRHLKRNFVKLYSTNPKRLWESIRCVGRFTKRNTSSPFSASVLNTSFFSNFQYTPNNIVPDDGALSSFTFPPIETHEVNYYLRHLSRKSSGPDGIPWWIFRDCADYLDGAITHLFNWSLREGLVPSCFKMAIISPIPKCARPTSVEHFRPISLLPILSKLLEKIVLKRFILPHVRHCISSSQFAFVPRVGSGTTNALVLSMHEILRFLDKPGVVRFLSVDFSKAFDKLPHQNILDACHKFHLPSGVIRWISNFLCHRKQRVRVNRDL